MYPGPCGQLAQISLFRAHKLPRLPEKGGWMQTGSCSWTLLCVQQCLGMI